MSGDDLRFHQTTFLQMQKDIFYDASTMHETHLDGGMQSIAELATAGLLGNTVTQRRTVDRAVRSAVNEAWGKKPACHVQVVEV